MNVLSFLIDTPRPAEHHVKQLIRKLDNPPWFTCQHVANTETPTATRQRDLCDGTNIHCLDQVDRENVASVPNQPTSELTEMAVNLKSSCSALSLHRNQPQTSHKDAPSHLSQPRAPVLVKKEAVPGNLACSRTPNWSLPTPPSDTTQEEGKGGRRGGGEDVFGVGTAR